MGIVKKKLFGRELEKPTCELYNDKLSIELAESFHVHLRNIRIEFDMSEFEFFSDKLGLALLNWNSLGRPAISDTTIYLPAFWDISSVSHVTPERFDIELQDNQWNSVHIHYRNLRLEFTQEEFKEFAEGVIRALRELEVKKSGENSGSIT